MGIGIKEILIYRLLFPVFLFFLSAQAFETADTLEFSTAFLNRNDTVIISVEINIPKNYHLYSNPKGPGTGKDLQIKLLDENLVFLFAKKQPPKVFLPPDEPDSAWVWAWEDYTVIFAAIKAENFDSAEIQIEGVYCDLSCVPFSKTVLVKNSDKPFNEKLRKIYDSSQKIPFEESQFVQSYNVKNASHEHSLFSAIFLAFLAGIILNFMPCVLPVLGIKILSFSQDTDKKTAILRSFAFAGGIIFVFLILAIVTVQMKVWWGQQFQNPVFITVLAILMIIGALFLFDIFTLLPNSKVANLDMKQDKSSLWGNFIRGICATILATPCSGPFLGAIMAWALIGNSKIAVFVVFLSVAAGMSSPYILLSIFGGVKISRSISKYSAYIKKILGVILLLFAVYLLFFMNYGKSNNYNSAWVSFSPELFENAQKNRQSVVVNFTADWCLNCRYNKISVYDNKEIQEIFRQKNILSMTADLTNENIPAQNLQEKLYSKSIPFLAVFDGNDFENPIVFYDIVNKKSFREVIENIK